MSCVEPVFRTLGLGLALGALLATSPGWAQTRSMVVPRDPEPRTGQVTGAPETMAQALVLAVRADAAGLWKRDDHGTGLTVRTEVVTWRDGAIGCPASDRMYSQATVPGWRIVVGDPKQAATYHATRTGKWLLCPADRVQAPLPGDTLR